MNCKTGILCSVITANSILSVLTKVIFLWLLPSIVMLRMAIFYFCGFEVQDKQKNEVLNITDKAWISFPLNLFYSRFLLLLLVLLSFWNYLFWVTECCNLFPLINVTPIYVGSEQYERVMRLDVYFAFCRNTHLWKKWTETSLGKYLSMHFTEYAFLFLPPLRESFFPLVNWVWHKGNNKSNGCCKPPLLNA